MRLFTTIRRESVTRREKSAFLVIPVLTFLLICCPFACRPFSAIARAADQVAWLDSIDEARGIAARSHRLVVVHFWSESCGPCLRLEKTVFHEREFALAVQTNYVPAKINIAAHKDVAHRYKIDRIPTDIILTPDGQEVFRTISPSELHKYVGMLDQVAAHARVSRRTPPTSEGDLSESIAVGSEPADQRVAIPPAARPPTAASSQPIENPYMPSTGPQRVAYRDPVTQQFAPPAGRDPVTQQFAPPAGPPAASRYSDSANASSGVARDPRHAPDISSGPRAAPNGAMGDFRQPPRATGAQMTMGDDGPSSVAGPGPSRYSLSAPPLPAPPNPSLSNPASPNPSLPNPSPPLPALPRPSPFSGANGQAPAASPVGAAPGAGGAPPGLDGYCPVSLVEEKVWKSGNPQWIASHEGRIYFFASPAHQQTFLRDPRRYAPVLAGFDVVRYRESGATIPGKREHGVAFNGRYYLFADEASLQRFWQGPRAYEPK